jgi:hypothetical protein
MHTHQVHETGGKDHFPCDTYLHSGKSPVGGKERRGHTGHAHADDGQLTG